MSTTARPSLLLTVPLLLALLAGGGRGEEEDGPDPFEEKVDAAIERGAAWLRTQQRNDGSYPGFSDPARPREYNVMDVGLNALVIQTLAHCGVDPEDDAIEKCFRFCKFHYAGGKGSWNLKGNDRVTIYTAAALILALDAAYRGIDEPPEIKRDRYGKPKRPRPLRCKYPTWVRKWIEELVDFIVEGQHASGGWRYPGNPIDSVEADTDLSNTQYALLALDAADRCGIKAPDETWKKAADYVARTQETEGLESPLWILNPAWSEGASEDTTPKFIQVGKTQARGWTYIPGERAYPTGSMTCAGVTCMALAKERLWVRDELDDEMRRRLDRGIVDGLAWLGDAFTVETNPDAAGTPQMWHYYYLYGLERAGSKCGVEHIGRHDWYRAGAEHLLAAQGEHGGWAEAEGQERPADATESAITQTCFALLFLERATHVPFVPVTPPTLTGGGR